MGGESMYNKTMPSIKLEKIKSDKDIKNIDCGVHSIQEMMKDAYYMTICKQAFAYNIIVNDKIVGNCLVRFRSFQDEEYYSNDMEYCALDISYLAIDKKDQGKSYGSFALAALIKDALSLSNLCPIRCLTLQALPGLDTLYQKYGFQKCPAENDPRFPDSTPMIFDFIDPHEIEQYGDQF